MKLESTLKEHAGFLFTAPLLDVVLLLLVFFLMSTNFVLRSGVSVSVPQSKSSLPAVAHSHVVTVMAGSSPRLFLNEDEVSFGEVREKLTAKERAVKHVIIRADELAAFGVVMRISELAKEQAYEVAFATAGE
jgi:biopolymer transport protein ExbD